jgi:hypothetical protein
MKVCEFRVTAVFPLGPDFIQRTRELEGIVGHTCAGSGAGCDGERDVDWYFDTNRKAVIAYNKLRKVEWLKESGWELVRP